MSFILELSIDFYLFLLLHFRLEKNHTVYYYYK